jgi:hypothetical protein
MRQMPFVVNPDQIRHRPVHHLDADQRLIEPPREQHP